MAREPMSTGEAVREPVDQDSPSWMRAVVRSRGPDLRASVWQLVNSLIPYILLWGIMIGLQQISFWLVLPVSLLAAGFLSRIFIIFHDCVHGSFTASPRANRVLEFITGLLTFTPYRQWRHQHALHHARSGDLDGRGSGAIWTLTVQEYMDATRWKRLGYRLFRHPAVLFVMAPLYLFLVHNRFPSRSVGIRSRRGVHMTNLALLAVVSVMSLTIGIKTYLTIQLPILTFTSIAGVWLFYVQHQFEGGYWERRKDWRFRLAALHGSSFYKLPRILQWFTGNIGFHHVHHLWPSIPNYRLETCHQEIPLLRQVRPLTLWSSRKSMALRLWDEKGKKLVSFGALKGRGPEDMGGP